MDHDTESLHHGATDGDKYFSSNPSPNSIDSHKRLARSFINEQVRANRNVVLVTSGGTTVPLENQTVRFIDNFSNGSRGATSAEYFLQAGYAVIFLHRQFSLLPYSRHYSHSTNCFLDFMTEGDDGTVTVDSDYEDKMLEVLRKYNTAKKEQKLLPLSFITINEYLWSLKELAVMMRPLGPRALFYLAAAVSDFFLPKDRLSEHKIQSSNANIVNGEGYPMLSNGLSGTGQQNRLMINLDPVPKFLKDLVQGWAPEGMMISFKLETDPSLLIEKSQQALKKYSHHLVIGNLLSTRRHEVVFITSQGEHWIKIPQHRRTRSVVSPSFLRKTFLDEAQEETATAMGDGPIEIESLIVPEVAAMHRRFIQLSQQNHEEDEQTMLANALAWAETGSD
ncbi:uncharacterized protein KY384_001009 [Bacidia gigantensis]|uniref:uncharacterized protein n=1 Tax=Bacidia gigantensis TaxID=2732470 RepID=UPI001D059330|nr:uncharacterized protein KY384_001009 [Bacidia gigantensis]KAG8534165.1 hypothetical protein KY384_001009 [Bacidia gigantensis]